MGKVVLLTGFNIKNSCNILFRVFQVILLEILELILYPAMSTLYFMKKTSKISIVFLYI